VNKLSVGRSKKEVSEMRGLKGETVKEKREEEGKEEGKERMHAGSRRWAQK